MGEIKMAGSGYFLGGMFFRDCGCHLDETVFVVIVMSLDQDVLTNSFFGIILSSTRY